MEVTIPASLALGRVDQAAPGLDLTLMGGTCCVSMGWRGGQLLDRPRVRDFSVTVAVTGLSEPTPSTRLVGQVLAAAALPVAHRMLWWAGDRERLSVPVAVPPGVLVPRLELLEWSVRPSAVAIADWLGRRVVAGLSRRAPEADLVALELRESPESMTVIRGVEVPLSTEEDRWPSGPVGAVEPTAAGTQAFQVG